MTSVQRHQIDISSNVDTKKLELLLWCPAGAESTGLYAVDEINGWTYVMSNFINTNYNNYNNNKAGGIVGYLTDELTQVKLSN